MLDNIKSTGYKYSTRGAITISIYDMSVPSTKPRSWGMFWLKMIRPAVISTSLR